MSPLKPLSKRAMWVARNIAYNIDFIPEDKFDWKPAPTASSALEIINHVLRTLRGMKANIEGTERKPGENATNREEAKQLLLEATEQYAACLRPITAEELERPVKSPFGDIPLSFAAQIPVIELIHHHGQIAYIQTLLGDTESHFHQP